MKYLRILKTTDVIPLFHCFYTLEKEIDAEIDIEEKAEKFGAEKNYIITPPYIILYYIIYFILLYFSFSVGRSYTSGKSNDLYQEIYKKP